MARSASRRGMFFDAIEALGGPRETPSGTPRSTGLGTISRACPGHADALSTGRLGYRCSNPFCRDVGGKD